MFKLMKILGGRMNVPDVIEVVAGSSTPTDVNTFAPGQALMHSASTGIVTKATGDVSVDYVCAESKTITGSGRLQVVKVNSDMVFEVPLSAAPGTTVKAGKHFTLHTDAEKMTATACAVATTSTSITNAFGCRVLDMNGASASGDKVLVTLA